MALNLGTLSIHFNHIIEKRTHSYLLSSLFDLAAGALDKDQGPCTLVGASPTTQKPWWKLEGEWMKADIYRDQGDVDAHEFVIFV